MEPEQQHHKYQHSERVCHQDTIENYIESRGAFGDGYSRLNKHKQEEEEKVDEEPQEVLVVSLPYAVSNPRAMVIEP